MILLVITLIISLLFALAAGAAADKRDFVWAALMAWFSAFLFALVFFDPK